MKKFIFILLTIVLMSVMTISAFARGHGNNRNATPKYPICTVEDCVLTGAHSHNNQIYCAHYYNDGHTYHNYCDVEECVAVGYHEHDDIYCFGHTISDGHEYHNYCNVSNCIYAGYHEHNGEYCFAHTANDGHGYHNMGNCHR